MNIDISGKCYEATTDEVISVDKARFV